mmetsp:Transcript_40918/g.105829  ORF Transcript_40918/g.105829 Transcript_40918/m.105829 type:complete len:971 (-) Transcript_40918:235-3147(-)
MEDTNVRGLRDAFAQTLTPNPEQIKAAEEFLKGVSLQPNFGICVLKVIAVEPQEQIRQAAAVNFKNHIKRRWVDPDPELFGGADVPPIADDEKEHIKGLITSLMVSTPPRVQSQLSEALTIISQHDFPAKWQALLPELTTKLKEQGGDFTVVSGVLETANSVFKRFRNAFMSPELSRELDYSQREFSGTALEMLKAVRGQMGAVMADGAALRPLLLCARLVCRIFFSLNALGLSETVEEQLKDWMGEFHGLLAIDTAVVDESDPDKESALDAVKAAVCENINLYMEKCEEEFQSYLGTFVHVVWELLLKVSPRPGQDNLAMSAIRFLTTVSRSVHHHLFKDAGALQKICENIVIPNLRLRAEDEETFEFNYVEYIRRDTEGSDSDTRRRAACELVKSLTEKFPNEVTSMFTGYVNTLLAEYAKDPGNNWQAKDCAIYLVVALTVRGKTSAMGATTTNQLVSIGEFFSSQVLPELQAADVNSNPFLKADALKFFTTFRNQLPKESVVPLLGSVINFFAAESNVVHSYAAICIERLLALKDAGQPRYKPGDLAPVLPKLLEGLFGALGHTDSGENEYLMKCIMRVLSFMGREIAPIAPVALNKLAEILLRVCNNPTQPAFNHYLFEAVAALIKDVCHKNAGMVTTFEQTLFPAFQIVLEKDVQEFAPYVFQIFSQLIEIRQPPLPDVYMDSLFRPLLSPALWERPGNVPALVRLLQAYLMRAGAEVAARGHIQAVLGVFQKLVSAKSSDHQGFQILATLFENISLDAMAGYVPTIWGILLSRLQNSSTTKYVKCFIGFCAQLVVKHSPAMLMDSLNKVQSGLGDMIVQQVWANNLTKIVGDRETKLACVATVKLLCESPQLVAPQAGEAWAKLLNGVLELLERGDDGTNGAAPEEDEYSGYTASFAQLHNAGAVEKDPVPEVKDPKAFLAQSLARLSQTQPGQIGPRVQQVLEGPKQQALLGYCTAAGVQIA